MKHKDAFSILLGTLIALVICSYCAVVICFIWFIQSVIITDADNTLLSFTIVTGAAFLGAILIEIIKCVYRKVFK